MGEEQVEPRAATEGASNPMRAPTLRRARPNMTRIILQGRQVRTRLLHREEGEKSDVLFALLLYPCKDGELDEISSSSLVRGRARCAALLCLASALDLEQLMVVNGAHPQCAAWMHVL